MNDCAICRRPMKNDYRSCCESCVPPDESEIKCAARLRRKESELEVCADKLSSVWLLLDDIARSARDSDQTRMAAAKLLMTQQCPGWKDKLCSNALWNADLPTPRTCETCGIGPCPLGLTRKDKQK